MKSICLILVLLYGIQISFGQEKSCQNLGQYVSGCVARK